VRRRLPTRLTHVAFVSTCLFALLWPARLYSQSSQPVREVLSDGVERWYFPVPESGKSYLTRKFEEMYKVVFSGKTQPFGRSIAFLAGVSSYQNLRPQLPSVRNDILQMRDLLLNKAGFDEVYVAEDAVVSRDLIEHYVKGIIPAAMNKNDRLLFYYSGHGGDDKGDTGYMLFVGAQKGEFWGPQVLDVMALSIWNSELKIQHVLFIVDSCSSGLAFTTKSAPDTSDNLLLQTLSGNGSRTVLTAGTADQAAFALEDRQKLGNGVFTRALLGAFESLRLSGAPMITVSDLFSDIEKQMAEFGASQGKATTPGMWRLRESDFRGTFVFLNQGAGPRHLSGEQAKALGITPAEKTASEAPIETATGIVEVTNSGPLANLSIDGQSMGLITGGEIRRFLQLPAGRHEVQINTPNNPNAPAVTGSIEVSVEGGKIAYATFGLKSPIDGTGKTPVGTLVLQSAHDLGGEAFIDGFRVGELGTNGQLTVANVTAGPHVWRLDDPKEGATAPFLIAPNETTYLVLSAPNAPSGLTATTQ
jgi:hypothetical protein